MEHPEIIGNPPIIHVNPHFKVNHVYVNPRFSNSRSIHINPDLLQNTLKKSHLLSTNTDIKTNVVYINPKASRMHINPQVVSYSKKLPNTVLTLLKSQSVLNSKLQNLQHVKTFGGSPICSSNSCDVSFSSAKQIEGTLYTQARLHETEVTQTHDVKPSPSFSKCSDGLLQFSNELSVKHSSTSMPFGQCSKANDLMNSDISKVELIHDDKTVTKGTLHAGAICHKIPESSLSNPFIFIKPNKKIVKTKPINASTSLRACKDTMQTGENSGKNRRLDLEHKHVHVNPKHFPHLKLCSTFNTSKSAINYSENTVDVELGENSSVICNEALEIPMKNQSDTTTPISPKYVKSAENCGSLVSLSKTKLIRLPTTIKRNARKSFSKESKLVNIQSNKKLIRTPKLNKQLFPKHSESLRMAQSLLHKYKYKLINNKPKISPKSTILTKYRIDRRSPKPFKIRKYTIRRRYPFGATTQALSSQTPAYHKLTRANKSWRRFSNNLAATMDHRKCGEINQHQKSIKSGRSMTTSLIRIGGVLYKASQSKLAKSKLGNTGQRHVSCNKRRKSRNSRTLYIRGNKFIMDSCGKTLKRDNFSNSSKICQTSTPIKRIDIGGITFIQKSSNVLVRTNCHTARNVVSQAKQKSILMLTKKMRKNNQPCLFFHKFGRCLRYDQGKCDRVHDPKQVAVCRKFLQGQCDVDGCLLSHNVGPEKMPTCKYFLESVCVKDNCPYLHVKVSSKAGICVNFLQGYCADGTKCMKRHENICPEFDRKGICSKGKYCPYPHKQKKNCTSKCGSSQFRKGTETRNKKLHTRHRRRSDEQQSGASNERVRYFEVSKSNNLLCGELVYSNKTTVQDQSITMELDTEEHVVKRPKLGLLPSFIALDSS